MEMVGGFMVMMSIISLFLAVVWLIMPFVVFAIKGKQDRTLEILETIEKRLAALEARLQPVEPDGTESDQTGSTGSADAFRNEKEEIQAESASVKNGQEAAPVA